MVIRHGVEWGSPGVPEPSLPVVFADREASRAIQDGCRELIVAGGDMALTLGAVPPSEGCSYRRLPVDLVEIGLTDAIGPKSKILVLSHCVVRNPWVTGGFARGSVTLICNAQYVWARDVAPRGHPNDGRVEILEFDARLGLRERLQILARTKRGEHLPHPSIRSKSVSTTTRMGVQGAIVLDGRRRGIGRIEYVAPRPDALVVWAALPHVPAAEED